MSHDHEEPEAPETPESAATENDPLVLGEEIDPAEALGEFADYDHHENDDDHPEPAVEGDGRETPKERALANMRLEARVESIIFASNKPLKAAELVELVSDKAVTEEHVQDCLDNLVDFYAERQGGFRLHYLKRMGYQFQTADQAAAIMERMFASRPRPISRAALETLAIIAYRQPCTRAEVEFIRGVDAGSIFKTLLERGLIKCTGRKEIIGRPMLFGTNDEFLKVFNLSSIKDLPPLEAFQPSRDVMQGAMDRIDEGGDDGELVDVEQYIADNADLTTFDEDLGDAPEEGASKEQTDHGIDAHPEVAFPDGPLEPPGGGELDH